MSTLQDKILRYRNKHYIIKDINIRGELRCHKIGSNAVNTFTEIDPLVDYTETINVWCPSRMIIGGSSLKQLLYLVGRPVTACVAYKNKQREYLILCGCGGKDYYLYKVADEGKSVWVANVKDGRVVSPNNQIYSEVAELTGFELSFSLKMYKLSDPIVGVTCYNILDGLLAQCVNSAAVDISFLSKIDINKKYNLMYIKNSSGHDHIIPSEDSLGYLNSESGSKLKRDEVLKYLKSLYDYPCIHFSDEELDKLSSILVANGYPLRAVLEKYNGKVSNFYFSTKGFSIAILDVPGSTSYEIRRLTCEPVLSYKGDKLYYELRSYPLAKDEEYRVLSSSVNEEYITTLLRSHYADTIRSSLVHYKGSDYYLKSFKDSKDECNISCYLPSEPNLVYSGVFSKLNGVYAYNLDVPNEARDFMSTMVRYFSDKYGILS